MAPQGRCYCGEITWVVTGKVDFTSACHCKVCQTVSGSAFGTTSLMVYDPNGVRFTGTPKVYENKSDAGNQTLRGFCGTCGTVLFNHVSEGKADEHWAMRTGCMDDTDKYKMDKELFMRSKVPWIGTVSSPENQFTAMPSES